MSNGIKIVWCKNCSSVIRFEQTNNEKNEDAYDICISCQSKKPDDKRNNKDEE